MLFMKGGEEENGGEELLSTYKANKELQRKETARDRVGARRLKSQRTKRKSKHLDANSRKSVSSGGKSIPVACENDAERDSDIEKEDFKQSSQIASVADPARISSDRRLSNKEIRRRIPQVRVPISVSLLIIAAYVFLGAVLFSLWEKNWDYLISSYFCFVTLSTIGFGDFVPGSDVESWSSAEKQAICTLYLLFGMAMIAMCFNLMQQEVILKFTDLGRRMGLIEEKQVSSLDEPCTE